MKLIYPKKIKKYMIIKTDEDIIILNDKFKKNTIFNRRFKKAIINFIVILYLIIGRILYIRSLKGCKNPNLFACKILN